MGLFRTATQYTIPKVNVLVSGTFQSVPGPPLSANYVASNAVVASSLGRNLSAGANVTVNLITPGALYGERLNQLDLRFGKVVRYRRARTTVSLDLYNATNRDTVLTENSNHATWRLPGVVVQGRLAKFSLQWDF